MTSRKWRVPQPPYWHVTQSFGVCAQEWPGHLVLRPQLETPRVPVAAWTSGSPGSRCGSEKQWPHYIQRQDKIGVVVSES